MRSLGLLLILAVLARAGERQVAEFRLVKDQHAVMRGWLLEYDREGFLFERFAGGSRTRIRWDDLVEEDARRMRIAFRLEMTDDEKKGIIDGQEIEFKGGGSVRGLLEGVDEDGTYRVRTDGLVLPYPGERVDRVRDVKVKEEEVYSPDEIYVRRLERRPPETAAEHLRLANYLFDIGNWEGARDQYELAVEKDPRLRADCADRMAEVHDILQDEAAGAVFAREKSAAVLQGKWREAIDNIRAYTADNPGAARRGERLIGELQDMWLQQKQARFHFAKHEELDRAVRSYLSRTKPDFQAARAWALAQLCDEVKERVQRRLGLSDDEMDMFLASKAKCALHWASYWTGSFAVSSRVKLGKSTSRTQRGDPDQWWNTYQDVSVRTSWLKAFVAERSDLFEVVQVNQEECERCGGSGLVTKWSPTALADGRHEWKELCPRCFGAKVDRGIGYR